MHATFMLIATLYLPGGIASGEVVDTGLTGNDCIGALVMVNDLEPDSETVWSCELEIDAELGGSVFVMSEPEE